MFPNKPTFSIPGKLLYVTHIILFYRKKCADFCVATQLLNHQYGQKFFVANGKAYTIATLWCDSISLAV